MSIEVVDVPNDRMEVSETKEDNAIEAKDKTPEPEAKRPRGMANGDQIPADKVCLRR